MRSYWSSRRRGIIFIIVLVSLLAIVGIPAYFASQDEPDCGNRVMDGDETGVDCGGSCQLLCAPEVLPIISRGEARLLNISTTTSTYVLAILLENPNASGAVERAPYSFSVYSGSSREPVALFVGETYVGRGSTFALFEGPFELEGPGPFRAVFEWGELVWEKSDEKKPIISVESPNLIISDNADPRLEASLINRSQDDVNNVEAVALLSDASGNVVAAGKTFVDALPAGKSRPVAFSWPNAFTVEPVSIRIIPHILPDKSYIR